MERWSVITPMSSSKKSLKRKISLTSIQGKTWTTCLTQSITWNRPRCSNWSRNNWRIKLLILEMKSGSIKLCSQGIETRAYLKVVAVVIPFQWMRGTLRLIAITRWEDKIARLDGMISSIRFQHMRWSPTTQGWSYSWQVIQVKILLEKTMTWFTNQLRVNITSSQTRKVNPLEVLVWKTSLNRRIPKPSRIISSLLRSRKIKMGKMIIKIMIINESDTLIIILRENKIYYNKKL